MKLAASTGHPAFVGAPGESRLAVFCAFSFKKSQSRNFVLFNRRRFGIRQWTRNGNDGRAQRLEYCIAAFIAFGLGPWSAFRSDFEQFGWVGNVLFRQR